MYKFIYLFIFLIAALSFANGAKLVISKFDGGQTHVIPAITGLEWKIKSVQTLHLVGKRDTLFVIEFSGGLTDLVSPKIEGLDGSTSLGSLVLNDPSKLPVTESNGTAYSTKAYSVLAPAKWLVPNVKVRVVASNYDASDYVTLNVGADARMIMYNLPFYLFGANDTNTMDFSKISTAPEAVIDELYNKWPVSVLDFVNHPAKRVQWPHIILNPNGTHPAIRATNKDFQRDGYEFMGHVLGILSEIRGINGDSGTNNQIYSPILWLNSKGVSSGVGGGLGGGHRGTGDASYSGIFIHEQGHAFGLPHAGEAYRANVSESSYPYVNGSLLGSAWGFDKTKNQFLGNFIPTEANSYKNCNKSYVLDGKNVCMKQTVMQGGSGCQAKGYTFSMFADYEAGVMQRYFEGVTTNGTNGNSYSGGRIVVTKSFPSGYMRWDSLDNKWVEFVPKTESSGLYGVNSSLPIKRDVNVYSMIASVSVARTPGATVLYPPLFYKGNLMPYIDPTDPEQLKTITPNKGPLAWYCHASDCGLTIRAAYPDGTVNHYLLQSGFKGWFSIYSNISADVFDPLKSASQRVVSINLPADKGPPSRYQILFTENGFKGIFPNATILLDYSCTGSGASIQCSEYVPPPTTTSTTGGSSTPDGGNSGTTGSDSEPNTSSLLTSNLVFVLISLISLLLA
ncbi:hypothetical protein CYY_004802 [Polysphondylium violaceum]|uniref:Peptidase M66 domain-containing protein n=1 Tax=Polysphondylium violaceum TaxID=133409 RepID=A0A8J4PSS1_9MYCE|nr:hypothetical protein CYY_004802 [Polysphondylium violaceum]